jgi:hypothetical protein
VSAGLLLAGLIAGALAGLAQDVWRAARARALRSAALADRWARGRSLPRWEALRVKARRRLLERLDQAHSVPRMPAYTSPAHVRVVSDALDGCRTCGAERLQVRSRG